MDVPLIYAIGDIHGCYEKLLALVAKIKAHAGPRPYHAIFLGDYVDRGPDSRRVVTLVRRLTTGEDALSRWSALKGNHEAMMIAALRGAPPDMWLSNGGEETRASYDGSESEMIEHAQWLEGLPTMIQTKNYCFVHAGCSPQYPLEQQPENVLLWIRGWELDNYDFKKHIVYGHTPSKEPLLLRHSSGLDTGACYGGPLTAGVFKADRSMGPVEILQAT